MARWQYLQFVEPLFTTTTEWGQPTQQPTVSRYAVARFITSAWVPQHTDAEGSDLGWTPRYPDQIFRFTVRAADQPFFSTGSTHSSLPVPEVSWKAIYPDLIPRWVVRAADQPFFATGSTASTLPVAGLPWIAKYPDFVWRTTLPTGAIPTLFVEPLPRPPANLLSAWGIYPDRISRLSVHPSRLPYFVPGPVVPIPNPQILGVIDEKIHLGTKESLGVTSQPTLGGWQAW